MSYETLLDEYQETVLAAVHIYIEEQGLRKPFLQVEDKEAMSEDKEFLCNVMKTDPSNKPTARALREHRWFDLP